MPYDVIVVEDDPDVRDLLAMFVKHQGVQVMTYASAEEVMDDVQTRAALLDLRLPGASGAELAARLRTQSPRTRIAFITAYDFAPELKAHPEARIFTKPVNFTELGRFIKSAMGEQA